MTKRRTAGKNKTQRGISDSRRGRLRIVAGNWRSRVLDIVDAPGLRPTPERVRETLFNWLGPAIAGRRCLDLFAGSGALGFEALSRGAKEAVFVENAKPVAAKLRKNIELLAATDADVVEVGATAYIEAFPGPAFDIVFLDPPFAAGRIAELCRLLAANGIVAADGLVYFEQDRKEPTPELPQSWTLTKQKTAGNVRYGLVRTGPNSSQ